jgi:hypothetical protein
MRLKQDLRTCISKPKKKVNCLFVRFQKLFHFSETNIKIFSKYLVNSNNQLKTGLNKEKTFSCIDQDIRLTQCITKTSLKHY